MTSVEDKKDPNEIRGMIEIPTVDLAWTVAGATAGRLRELGCQLPDHIPGLCGAEA